MQIEIVLKPVNEIIPYWRNPRRNDATVDALVEVIQKRGFNVPIVVDKNGVVIKGHARLRAAKKLGLEKVPCIVSNVSEEVAKADRIADNKIQELSSWDFAKRDMELQRLEGKLQFKKLFFAEKLEQDEIPEVKFKPAGLEFWDGGYEGEADIFPASGPAPATEAQPITVAAPVAEGVPAKKQLKTLCPYCGKVVVVNV